MPLPDPDQTAHRPAGSDRRAAVLLSAAVAVGSAGWFVLSWQVAHNPVSDAIGEALGVALALLVVISVIGAIRGRNHSPEPDR